MSITEALGLVLVIVAWTLSVFLIVYAVTSATNLFKKIKQKSSLEDRVKSLEDKIKSLEDKNIYLIREVVSLSSISDQIKDHIVTLYKQACCNTKVLNATTLKNVDARYITQFTDDIQATCLFEDGKILFHNKDGLSYEELDVKDIIE